MDETDRIVHSHDGPFFTGTVVKASITRSPSSEFNLFQTRINEDDVTTLRGDGVLVHNGNASIVGTMSLVHAGNVGLLSSTSSDRLGFKGKLCKMLEETSSDSCRNDVLFVSSVLPKENTFSSSVIRSQIVSNGAADGQYHYQAYNGLNKVASLSNNGDLMITGDLVVGPSNQSSVFSIVNGYTSIANVHISSSLEVQGSATVEDSLLIGTGFALTPGGMTVDVSTHVGTLFELRSRQPTFNGSLLEIHTNGPTSSMIKAVTNDIVTFELSSAGFVKMQGLEVFRLMLVGFKLKQVVYWFMVV